MSPVEERPHTCNICDFGLVSLEQNLEAEANFLQISEGENEALAKNRAEDSMIELCDVSCRRYLIIALPEVRAAVLNNSGSFFVLKSLPTSFLTVFRPNLKVFIST